MASCGNVEEVAGTWWVGHVKPSQERRLADELDSKGIDFFLPLVTRRVKRHGRYEEAQSVLFPQYVFFAGQVDENQFCQARYEAVMTHRLCGVLPVVNQSKFVRQLRAVQLAIHEKPKVGIYHGVTPGQRCVVLPPHSMQGVEGYCQSVRSNRNAVTVVLRVDMLGDSIAMDIDAEFVEPM